MLKKKKIAFSVILISNILISLVVGFVYNKILDSYTLDALGSFDFSTRFLVFALLFTLLGAASYFFIKNIHASFAKHKSSLKLAVDVIFVVIMLGILWYGKTHCLGSLLLTSLVIAFVLPIIIYIILETLKYRKGFVAAIIEVILFTIVIGVIFGIKFALYSLLILNLVTILCVKDQDKRKDEKLCFTVYMIGASVILGFIVISASPSLIERQYDFCHQAGIAEYDAIKDSIRNAKLINLNFSTELLDKVNTVYGCTYTHFLEIYGVIPLILFLMLQISSVIIMGIISEKSQQNDFFKSILWFCTGTVGFQLLAGLSTSFLLMPISEFGGLFITLKGMGFSIVPMIVFFLLAGSGSPHKCKIVIAGGISSGKTSVIKELKKCLNSEHSRKIKFVDEVANSVLMDASFSYKNKIEFQKTILSRQKEEEENVDADVEVIISDRGIADAYVYLSDDEIKMMEGLDDLNQVLSEYDVVIYLEKSDNSYLEKDGDTIRVENTAEEVERITERTKEVWSQHHNVIYVEPFDSVEEKGVYVAKLINNICKLKIFRYSDERKGKPLDTYNF